MSEVTEDRFWLSLREPGCVPVRKGPWHRSAMAKVLREFIAARPTAYIDVITVGFDGSPEVQHGPEALQMRDGRSMRTASRHNDRVRKAEAALATAQAEADALKAMLREQAENAAAAAKEYAANMEALRAEVVRYAQALVNHNDVLRSAYQIAARKGEQTEWDGFTLRAGSVLHFHHEEVEQARAAIGGEQP